MRFNETKIKGVFIIDIEPLLDERGFFARTVCVKEFMEHGLKAEFLQSSISYNRTKGILRGMHYQTAGHEEEKLIRCIRGSIYDVVVDLRPSSSTFLQWFFVELTQDNARAIYVPKGCAHGFQTLDDNTVVLYQMTEVFHAESAAGVRWNDPAFGIQWPEVNKRIISDKDQRYSDFLI